MSGNEYLQKVEAPSLEYQPNLAYLNDLSGGDKTFVSEIIQMFIVDAPEIINQAQGYLEEAEFDLLKITVHKLKSSVQVLGNHQLASLIQEIEVDSKNDPDSQMLSSKIGDLHHGIQSMIKHLTVALDTL